MKKENSFKRKDSFDMHKFNVGASTALLSTLLYFGVSHSAEAAENDRVTVDIENDDPNTVVIDDNSPTYTKAPNPNDAVDLSKNLPPETEHEVIIDSPEEDQSEPTNNDQNVDSNQENPGNDDQSVDSDQENPGNGDQSDDLDAGVNEPYLSADPNDLATIDNVNDGQSGDLDAGVNEPYFGTDLKDSASASNINNNSQTNNTDVGISEKPGVPSSADSNDGVSSSSNNSNPLTYSNEQEVMKQDSTSHAMNSAQDNNNFANSPSKDKAVQSKNESNTEQQLPSTGMDNTLPISASTAMLIGGLALLVRRRQSNQ
ncbi:LPXTG cell wall anchor domain-containing protein [Staphylococcus sp. SQ8-PEA]|uniref:LPXTG cell wall anchor domain-containing protein n=1 Tax=Staphylococcus marylandisciuri TaxID=2981529 RepID=A0ABT2QRN6_9STAP|nr:LPXTG cell wall anchor domain-containing protein [Staphylococcus marylandisciuri]MCU5746641.1 LPXTG cell wall anchor domain-containing protein [Staphylococcus marylandisciuri]